MLARLKAIPILGSVIAFLVFVAVLIWGLLQREKRKTDRMGSTIKSHEKKEEVQVFTNKTREKSREEGREKVKSDVNAARRGRRDHFES